VLDKFRLMPVKKIENNYMMVQTNYKTSGEKENYLARIFLGSDLVMN